MKTKTIALLAVLLVAVAAGGALGVANAYAQTGNATSTIAAATSNTGAVSLQFSAANIMAMLSGAIWAGIGFARAKQNGQGFDGSNAAPTVVVGFIIGLIASVAHLPFDQVSNFTVVQVLTIVVDKLFVGQYKKASSTPTAVGAGTTKPPGT